MVNIYYLWKIAEMVSGHTTEISGEYKKLKHTEDKEPTWKWFVMFLLPVLVFLVGLMMLAAGELAGTGVTVTGLLGFIVGMVLAPIVGIYLLYKVSIPVSGHEKRYGDETRIEHMESKESTVKWMAFSLTGVITFYYLWKASEMISGHEVTE